MQPATLQRKKKDLDSSVECSCRAALLKKPWKIREARLPQNGWMRRFGLLDALISLPFLPERAKAQEQHPTDWMLPIHWLQHFRCSIPGELSADGGREMGNQIEVMTISKRVGLHPRKKLLIKPGRLDIPAQQ